MSLGFNENYYSFPQTFAETFAVEKFLGIREPEIADFSIQLPWSSTPKSATATAG